MGKILSRKTLIYTQVFSWVASLIEAEIYQEIPSIIIHKWKYRKAATANVL